LLTIPQQPTSQLLLLLLLLLHSCAQTAMHPANVLKTIIQTEGKVASRHLKWSVITRGAGAQFLLSVPHGAMAFALVEVSKML